MKILWNQLVVYDCNTSCFPSFSGARFDEPGAFRFLSLRCKVQVHATKSIDLSA